eukprot:9421508-Pyramimonas_sp.AAC.1
MSVWRWLVHLAAALARARSRAQRLARLSQPTRPRWRAVSWRCRKNTHDDDNCNDGDDGDDDGGKTNDDADADHADGDDR